MKFKVISAKGFSFGGKSLKQGDTFTGERYQGHVSTGIHFGQIEPVTEAAIEAAKTDEDPKPEVSDAARKLAEEKGIDLATVTGTGKDGSITKPDVEAAIEAAK